ncbi:hypothetical protein D0B88_03485 [Cellvibrio sp. KY-YJ-3]|nr:hypothetical protein D0B88_03485 [Cellvibrio sp. KY-YJ-3]
MRASGPGVVDLDQLCVAALAPVQYYLIQHKFHLCQYCAEHLAEFNLRIKKPGLNGPVFYLSLVFNRTCILMLALWLQAFFNE